MTDMTVPMCAEIRPVLRSWLGMAFPARRHAVLGVDGLSSRNVNTTGSGRTAEDRTSTLSKIARMSVSARKDCSLSSTIRTTTPDRRPQRSSAAQ